MKMPSSKTQKPMKKYICLIIGLLMGVLFVPASALAQSSPSLPMSFWGTVTINGTNAPIGTVVSSYSVGGTLYDSTTTTTAGLYGTDSLADSNPAEDRLLFAGTGPITFKAVVTGYNGGVALTAEETQAYTAGVVGVKNLTFVTPATPSATPAAGEYSSSQSVSLASAGSTSIYYTLDGTAPDATKLLYGSAISISSSSTKTLKAIAYDAENGSQVLTQVYTFASGVCVPASVTHGSVGVYPGCAITCDSGYASNGSACVYSGGGGGGGGGGGSPTPTSATAPITTASGGTVNFDVGNGASVKLTVPANAVASAVTATITPVPNSSSTYIPPAATTGLFMVGADVYQITAMSGSTSVTIFGQPVTLTFTYTLAQLPIGVSESSMQVYYFDTTSNSWVVVPSVVNTATHTITATVSHLTQFAVFGTKGAAVVKLKSTTEQLQATLDALIVQLKVLIKAAIAQGKVLSPELMAYVQESSPAAVTSKVTANWHIGQKGDEVKIIQTVLAKDSTVYPEAQVTGYFGLLTQKAVQRFQVKYGIAKAGDSGYGLVGPKTRAKINSILGL
jgi:hypothetical protein